MHRQSLQDLKRLPLFQALSDDRLLELTQSALMLSFPAGTELFQQGAMPDFLHVLIEGRVQLIAEGQEGRESIVEVVQPVDCFILAAALTDAPYLMTAKALDACRVLLIPAATLRQQVHDDGELALTMLGSLASQFRDMVRNVKNLKLRNANQRLACYLLALYEDKSSDSSSISLDLDKKLLASRLGVTPETLSRSFAALSKNGGIRVQRQRVHFDDPDALRALCCLDPLIDNTGEKLHV